MVDTMQLNSILKNLKQTSDSDTSCMRGVGMPFAEVRRVHIPLDEVQELIISLASP